MIPNQLTKDEWVAMFQQAGLTEEMMHRWHQVFEQNHPEAHQAFLEGLQIPAQEITRIRNNAKKA